MRHLAGQEHGRARLLQHYVRTAGSGISRRRAQRTLGAGNGDAPAEIEDWRPRRFDQRQIAPSLVSTHRAELCTDYSSYASASAERHSRRGNPGYRDGGHGNPGLFDWTLGF